MIELVDKLVNECYTSWHLKVNDKRAVIAKRHLSSTYSMNIDGVPLRDLTKDEVIKKLNETEIKNSIKRIEKEIYTNERYLYAVKHSKSKKYELIGLINGLKVGKRFMEDLLNDED